MKLLFDIGNTYLKWSVYNNGSYEASGKLLCQSYDFVSELSDFLRTIAKPDVILMANVNSVGIEETVQQTFRDIWQETAWVAKTTNSACGVNNAYATPEKLGVDRWLVIIAARSLTQNPYCVVDCGSAITIDYVEENGQHHGGLILPNQSIMQNALVSNTVNLKIDSSQSPMLSLAKDTETAIRNGCYYASFSAIKQACHDLQQLTQNDMDYYMTGGGAESMLKQDLGQDFNYLPNMVFDGLLKLYDDVT